MVPVCNDSGARLRDKCRLILTDRELPRKLKHARNIPLVFLVFYMDRVSEFPGTVFRNVLLIEQSRNRWENSS